MTWIAQVIALVATACGASTTNNEAPVVAGQSITTPEDIPITFLLAASDPEGRPLTLTFTPPGHGKVSQDYRRFTYAPTANYHGPDSLQVLAADGSHTVSATITINVTTVNDAPVALDDAAATVANAPAVIQVSALLANDSDVDGDTLSVISVASPDHGAVTLVDDVVTFTPTESFVGDATFLYTVSDGTASDTAPVTIHVGTDNEAPVAVDDTTTTAEDAPAMVSVDTLLANDSDPDGQMLMLIAVAAATHGSVSLASGTITFTPQANFNGTASFEYLATDGAASTTGHVAVTVTPVPDRPVAIASTVITDEDTGVTITLTGSDPDGDLLTFAILVPPLSGSLGAITQLTPTTASVTYAPSAGSTDDAIFAFTVADASSISDSAIIAIDVVPVDDPPLANPGMATTDQNEPVTITLTGSDAEGDALTFGIATPPVHGMVGTIATIDAASASIVYTPDLDSVADDSFTFIVDDGNSTSLPATISIDVIPACGARGAATVCRQMTAP